MMRIIEIITFVAAFVIVTAGIIYLNSVYVNIFAFDFTPRSEVIAVEDSLDEMEAEKEEEILEQPIEEQAAENTIEKIPEVKEQQTASKPPVEKPVENKPIVEKKTEQIPVIEEVNVSVAQNSVLEVPQRTNNPVDSTYIKWVKSTAGLFESMEAKKAALIIKNYREDVARDIIYKMKRKKAAEVLAELDPYQAKRITEYW